MHQASLRPALVPKGCHFYCPSRTYVAIPYNMFRLMNGLFYPQHILYVKATELAFEDCFHDGDWAEAVNYGTLCLHSYQKYTVGNQVSTYFS